VTDRDVLQRRLRNQRLLDPDFDRPEEAVAWLGAVQSQDYPGAKWALAQRVSGVSEADIDAAFDAGRILRTHAMRPTWHFVMPADIRWLLELTAPRVRRILASYDRRLGITPALIAKSRRIFEKTLGGDSFRTRTELAGALASAGISAGGQTLARLVMHAELDAVLCSGPRNGRQFTYALLAERAPKAKALTADEALCELTARYFRSHGPATLRDFSWWSGLTMADARRGAALAALRSDDTGALTLWFDPADAPSGRARDSLHLLPNYDEYLIAHKDRTFVLDAARRPQRVTPVGSDPFAHVLTINGKVEGVWKRTISPRVLEIDLVTYRPLTDGEARRLKREADRYGRFLGLPADLRVRGAQHVR